ncbi:laccase [Tricholoma matsutake]|nr:laccase [Tricholoma matsutake 945]
MVKLLHLLWFSASLLWRSTDAAIGPVGDLVIRNAVISPDGFDRSAVLPGGTFPGPVIRGNKGDRFQINVVDHLTDATMLRSTSIHWHGILQQKKSSWADGAAFITQCPIAAGDSFLYNFRTADQAGTFWYHSHLSTQYCDGLRGAFIIYDPDDPHKNLYDIDDESTVITLADWYHVPAREAPRIPQSQATLINGKGRYLNGPAVPLSVINVQQGKRYRFRIIAMSCDPSFAFSIDGHNLTIIEADGENTAPWVVDSVQVYAGQRYSALLVANQPIGNYWMRADPDSRGLPGFDGGRNSAILRYAGAPDADPTTAQTPNVRPLVETDLHALTDPAAPGRPVVGGADMVLTLNLNFDFKTFTFSINGVSFKPPTTPVLLQILSGAKSAQDLLPSGSLYALPPNKVIEINIPGLPSSLGGPHPFHLHGHSFSVIRSANSTAYNFANPVRRDTVSTGLHGSNTTIRFVTDNPGPWFLHCHIDWHLDIGMSVVMVEDFGDIAAKDPVPDAWQGLCPRYDSSTLDQP